MNIESCYQVIVGAQAVNISLDSPFMLANMRSSPVYIDLRRVIYFPALRDTIVDNLVDLIKERQPNWSDHIVSGAATADIPFATLVADRLKLPLVYIRSPKDYGMKKIIEGGSVSGRQVIHISDLITSGRQGAAQIQQLREHGAVIDNYYTILCRSKSGARHIALQKVKMHALCSLDGLLEFMKTTGALSAHAFDAIIQETA